MQPILCSHDLAFFHCDLRSSNSIIMEVMGAVHYYVRKSGIQQQCR